MIGSATRRAREGAITVLAAAAVPGLWYLGAHLLKVSGDPIATSKLPYPHLVLERMIENPGTLADATWTTLGRALMGFAIGAAVGLLISIVLVQARWIESAFMPYVLAAQMIPLVALVPIARTILKSDDATRLFMAAFITFFSVTLAAVRGLKAASPDAVALMRSYYVGRLTMLRYLSFPASMPFLFSGLRIAAPLSLVGAIVVDLMGAQQGLGFLMLSALTFGPAQATMLWAAVVVTLVLGFLLAQSVAVVERLATPWQVGLRTAGE